MWLLWAVRQVSRGPIPQEEGIGSRSGIPQPLALLCQKLSEVMKLGVCPDARVCFAPGTGAGIDGVEEIKRHPFFVTIDWNVSRTARGPPHMGDREVRWRAHQLGTDQRGTWPCPLEGCPLSGAFWTGCHFTGTDQGPPSCSTRPESPLTLGPLEAGSDDPAATPTAENRAGISFCSARGCRSPSGLQAAG